ncbi:MAG: Hsp20/alpha crystallin family protein [Actinoplanes sp.]
MLLRSATAHDLDRLTARVAESTGRSSGCRLNAYRIDDNFFVDIDLPGADPVDVDITEDGTTLTLRAERKRAEGPAGPVNRQVKLAEALDTDRLDARYEDGVLTLRIPMKPEVSA